MKNNKMKVLSALLLCQVLLFFVTRGEKAGKVFDKTKDLVSIDFTSVDRFSVAVNEKEHVEFVKGESSWFVPSHFNFPADEKKIESLFSTLKELKQSWPAGKTLLSAKQFSVTDKKYDKRLDFYKGETLLGTLYIGSSPSFKKVHMRLEGEDNTYVTSFSSFEYQAKAEPWLNKSVYKTSKTDLASIQVGPHHLKASDEGGKWNLEGLKVSEAAHEGKINQVVNLVLSPSFRSVVGDSSFKTGKKHLSYELELKDGVKRSFSFFEKLKEPASKSQSGEGKIDEGSQNFVMKVSDLSYAFEVARSEVQDLLDLKREDLVQIKETKEKEPSTN